MRGTLVSFCVVLCLLSGPTFGQVLTGMISGTVTDASDAIVPSATITIVSADTGVTVWRGVTNESGLYRAPSLPVGRYNVIAELEGFKRAQVSGINLTVDQRAAINLTLQPGALTESITVAGQTAGQLATESSSLGNTINTTQVQNLPLPSRNILNLLSLAPGVSSGGDANSINASQLSMNGSRTVNSEFTVNGVSVVSGSTGGIQTLPSADAIREVKVRLFAGINASSTLNLSASKLNFAPRAGLAYSITPKTVIRSGFGIFYSQIFSDLGAQVLFPGYTISQSFGSLGTGIAQPFSLSQGTPLVAVQNLQNPQSTLSQFGPANPLSASASFAQAGPLPYASQWNFGVQRELARGLILEANYAGSGGVHLPLNLPYNRVPFSAATEAAQIGTQAFTQSLRPFPSVAGFSAISMAGHSSYHGLQITAKRQYTSNLAFIANYTRSKAIDDGSGLFSFSQPEAFDEGQFPAEFRKFERAVSAFDRPTIFTAAIQYRTPGPRWLRNIELDPIITARDGLPTSITQNNLNSAARGLRPNVINNTSIHADRPYANGTGIQYLLPVNTVNFPLGPVGPLFTGTGTSRTPVLPASIGSLGRNTIHTPGEFDVDLAAGREFPITEHVRFRLRGEAFNMLNHTNFRGPNTSLTVTTNSQGQPIFNSPGFGIITAARAARFMQLVGRIEF